MSKKKSIAGLFEEMKSREKIRRYVIPRSCLSTTLLVLFLPISQVVAQEVVTGDTNITEFPKTQTLDPLKPEDIFFTNRGTATSQPALLAPAPFQNNIIRKFEWIRQVPLDQLPNPLIVTYALKGYNEQADKFSDQSNPRSVINVALRNQVNQLVFQDRDRNVAVIEGSIEFVLDPSLSRAGKHGGKLSVCILSRSGTCL